MLGVDTARSWQLTFERPSTTIRAKEAAAVGDVPSRAEFQRLSAAVQNVLERLQATDRELEIQFQRMADLQADIDVIRGAWAKVIRKRTPKSKRAS